jgi:hypothetical protein
MEMELMEMGEATILYVATTSIGCQEPKVASSSAF